MQPSGIRTMQRDWAVWPQVPWIARFLGKFVLDILPAALASVIGGFVFTQYHFAQTTSAQPTVEQATPASAEMMAMIRDEHAQIMGYLKAQAAAERSRDLAADADTARAAADARAQADAKLADALIASQAPARQSAALIGAPKAVHPKPAIVLAAAPQGPLVIAQAQPVLESAVAPPDEGVARVPNALFAKTLDIKDHVVAATRHVVMAIGDMFASVGNSIGSAVSGGRQFSSAS